MSTVFIEAALFNYTVFFSARRQSVALQIKDGSLSVKAPKGFCLKKIAQFIEHKQDWILKHLANYNPVEKNDWQALGRLPLLDTQVNVVFAKGVKSHWFYSNDTLTLIVSSRISAANTSQAYTKLVKEWYQQQALDWFKLRVCYWQAKMGLEAGDILVGNWRSKWGYCKSTKEIGFNWRLMMAPSDIVDYVIVHELAHLKHLNHSDKFWQVVHKYYPLVDKARGYLKVNQHLLEL